ncbi:MAG: CBS domain-containing protein [Synergistaceae bacterium]|nr:CBS domain-containing protein [Synergistaceae bacterium]
MHLITSHLNTDFDSLASMIAIQKLYPDAVICPPGSMSRKVREFMSRRGYQWASKILKPKKIPLDEITLMIVVDARSRSRIGPFAALAGRQDVAVHVYDHHPATPDDIPAEELVYEPIGASITMILEHLLNERKEITPEEATLFALGIYDDTGALTYETTTERDIAAISYLRDLGADLSGILLQVETDMSADDRKLLDNLAENAREIYINGAKVYLTWAETEQYILGLSVFVNKLKEYCDSHVTIAVVNNGGKKINVIARSVEGVLNVKEFLAPYGGSGHYQAGSATLTDRDAKELLDEIEKRLAKAITPLMKVADIMTSPVIAVSPDSRVDEGYRTMLRFGLKSLPVANSEGEVVGMMTRRDLDKAHLHGLDRAKISDFMTQGVISLAAEASIDEAHRMMATYGFEKMPVLDDNGKLVVTLSRAVLLKAIYHSGQFAG